jgi:hypothetical protein
MWQALTSLLLIAARVPDAKQVNRIVALLEHCPEVRPEPISQKHKIEEVFRAINEYPTDSINKAVQVFETRLRSELSKPSISRIQSYQIRIKSATTLFALNRFVFLVPPDGIGKDFVGPISVPRDSSWTAMYPWKKTAKGSLELVGEITVFATLIPDTFSEFSYCAEHYNRRWNLTR